LFGFVSQFFENHPDQQCRCDVISLRTIQAALAVFDARDLFSFPMKLLDFPPLTARLLSLIGV